MSVLVTSAFAVTTNASDTGSLESQTTVTDLSECKGKKNRRFLGKFQ